jgi:alpha-tubulin suppressor-like RCC1 family protein
MPTFYNFRENGLDYKFDDVFIPVELFREGNLWVWGNNQSGQLGNNNTTDSFTPVTTSLGGANWKQIVVSGSNSVGGSFGAAIKTDGTLWTWGNGNFGKLGNADTTDRSTPVTTFAGGTNWKQVGIGRNHTTAIKTDGTLWTWGYGGSGRLGTNDTTTISTPVTTFAGGTNWKQVSTGDAIHTAAIKTDGTLWTWGFNLYGQLGNNSRTNRSTPVTTSSGGTNWKQVSSSFNGTSAVKTDGTLWTWGSGNAGKLGGNNNTSRSIPSTTFVGGTDWKQVSSGINHTAAIKTDGTLWTWGYNGDSELGRFTDVKTPVTTFAGGNNWADTATTEPEDLYTLSSGIDHTAAIKTDGTLWTWGRGAFGQLGTNDTTPNRSTPVTTFTGGTNWKQISSGDSYTAAIKTDGTLWTWGNTASGKLGRVSFGSIRSTPITTFAGGTNWADTATGVAEELYTLSASGNTGTSGHIVAIKTDGTLWTWGSATFGRLGNAVATGSRSTPVTTFAGGTNWKQVSGGYGNTKAIKTDGTLWTWGDGEYGKLGTNDTTNRSTPVTTFAGGTNWKQISGESAIKTDGTLWTWGYGGYGETGTNELFSPVRSIPVTTFAGGTNWADTATGAAEELYTLSGGGSVYTTERITSLVIKTDGTLWVWGYNLYGQLGTNDETNRFTPVTTFAGGTNWKQVSSSGYSAAAIKTDGTLWTWGKMRTGGLGNGITTGSMYTPITTFAGGTNWKQVSVGYNAAAAIKTDGTLWTWGYNHRGQIGNNNVNYPSTPVTTFAGGTNWRQVSCGGYTTSAIKTDGTLWTWGYNFGQLGTNDLTNRSTPVTTFTGGTNWKQVSVGPSSSTAIKTDGTLWSWGCADYGQLGRLSALTFRMTPVTTFAGGTNWADTATGAAEELYTISAGNNISTAIKTDGTLWTWGDGTSGRLGNFATTNRSTPVTTFAGGTNWKQVSSGENHTAAIKTDGTLWSWGFGSFGRLGNSATTTRSTPVTTFAGGADWKQVSAGDLHTAAVKIDGTLWTWGAGGFGRLGTNDTITTSTPVTTFAGGTDWKQVSAGGDHTAAIKTDGTLWTWGLGSFGRLGTNDTLNTFTPVTTFAGGTNWKQVSSSGGNTAAIKTDGTLWTWGASGDGGLGTNDTISRSTPVTTFAGGTNWKQVSTSGQLAAIKTDGTLWTWGYNLYGQLGTNDTTNRSTPVTTFAGGTNWKQVSCGYHTIALKDDGVNKELYVFGSNESQQLGTNYTSGIPEQVSVNSTDWKQVSSNGELADKRNQKAAAIKTDGTLWTWGNASYGALGNALSDFTAIYTPVTTFLGGTDWRQVSVGISNIIALKGDGINNQLYVSGKSEYLGINWTNYVATPVTTFAGGTNWKQVGGESAIKTDGTLWTWGSGESGELGNANLFNAFTPVTTFAGGTNWKQVSSGENHTAAIKTDGTLWTWGAGGSGRLGNSATTTRSTPVTTFAGGADWKQVSAGDLHTAAIKTDGTLWVWGSGTSGKLGTNDTLTRSTPVTTFAGGTDWKQVSAGLHVTMALKDDGVNKELYIFGDNFNAPLLGNNYNFNTTIPDEVLENATNWKQVSVANLHTAAIKTDGTLWTWGNGVYGKLGTNDTLTRSTPVTTFTGGTDWKQVSSGDLHTAAIKTDGTLWTWGSNGSLKLGRLSGLPFRMTPVTTFAGGTNWADTATTEPEDLYTLSAGGSHTGAIKTDGTLWTWGFGSFGRLGNFATTTTSTPVTTFAGGTNWKQVSSGGVHTAAIKTDGTLWTWGYGGSGRLGTNDTTNTSTPVTTFAGGTDWKQVSAGGNHIAAIKTDGTLWTWGSSTSGRLGNAVTSGNISTPVTTFAGGADWTQVSVGDQHTAAIKTDGTLWTWGSGGNGRLGNFATTTTSTPVTTFAGGTDWKQVSAGSGHTSAIKTDGTLWVWGSNFFGQLGDNIIISRSTPVTTFAGGTNWKQITCADSHTAAIKTDGTLWTWGFNLYGQLGNNSTTNTSTPVTTFAGGTNWKQVSAGYNHTVALRDDGVNKELYVFGNNQQLGINPYSNTEVPDQVGGTNWKQVSSGENHTAAIKTDGTLWTWGAGGSGKLGTNDTTTTSTPVTTFAGGTDWKQVSAGGDHTAAIKTDGTLWTWGLGADGRLGNNSIASRSTPVTTFAGGTDWKQVSAAKNHTIALKNDGVNKELYLFGINGNGEIGNADITSSRSTPVQVFGSSANWKQVSAGEDHTAAIKTDGTLWTWGNGVYGKLGTNDTTTKYIPVTTFAGGTNWKQVSSGFNHTAAVTYDDPVL